MYKLFLTFRYLTRKKIVIFPILVVWLCVMMLVIVSSIMGGFVERVRQSNHDLFGDIVISNGGSTLGWSHYDQLQTELRAKFPEIEASTPVVEAFALIHVGHETRPARLVGIDPVGRSMVTKFRESLFRQYQGPIQAADDLAPRLPATQDQLVKFAQTRTEAAIKESRDAHDALGALIAARPAPRADFRWLLGLLPIGALAAFLVRPRRRRSASSFVAAALVALFGSALVLSGILFPLIFPHQLSLAADRASRAEQDVNRAVRVEDFAAALPPGRYADRSDLLQQLLPAEPSFTVPPEAAIPLMPGSPQTRPAPDGIIIGSRMGFFERDQRGNFLRDPEQVYYQVVVTVYPASRTTGAVLTVNSMAWRFTNIDDSYSGVYDVDLQCCYADFQKVQELAAMRPDPEIVKENPAADFAPLCNQVLIKLKEPMTAERMREVRARIADAVRQFQGLHPDMSLDPVVVRTWDEEQARYLNAVKNEKTMMTFILGLMSCVVLVVIFLIFYQIVRDKTRDIGIIKAVGGSEEGVAGIFLIYGLFVGIVGGLLGVASGVLFVTHTNEIHEWIFRTTGVVIWDRSVYLFDTIPDQVSPPEVAVYFSVALAAGVLGALIPALVAAVEDPVKAVRYE